MMESDYDHEKKFLNLIVFENCDPYKKNSYK